MTQYDKILYETLIQYIPKISNSLSEIVEVLKDREIVEDKNLFVGDTIYCAPNGATDFGLPASAAGYYDDGDLSWIGCPIILDFLIYLIIML